ncbi:alpha/beta hydrolase [Burkholderia cepacia]|nr:alpha/beta hydrolase [Burkholderia cepacia]
MPRTVQPRKSKQLPCMFVTMGGEMRRIVDAGRRRVLSGAIAATAAALASKVGAQQSAQHGKPVWLDFDQASLDRAYDQAAYAPNLDTVIKRWETNSEDTRTRLGAPRKLRYGPTSVETLDLYPADAQKAPIHVFVHGGAWRAGSASQFSFIAEMFVKRGVHFIAPDFINVIEAGGNLMQMSEQVNRCLEWVYRNAASFGGDPDRIYLSGHSSGAHLAAVALTTNWERDFRLPGDFIKAATLVSGIYDLKPVRLSSRSKYVKFTDEAEARLSPQRHLDQLRAPLVLVHGTLETPEFVRQSDDFAAAVRKVGKPAGLAIGRGYNHVEILETLGNPYGVAGRYALAQLDGAAFNS